MEEEKRRKAKLANAFAFGNEDDDDKREQERIAAAKQAAQQWKQEMQNKVRPNKADVQGTRPRIDMYTALKMIADFKRSCNGKAKPMPPEIVSRRQHHRRRRRTPLHTPKYFDPCSNSRIGKP
ncbi:slc43a2 [Symbiodinium pilosum]|uniref:Slc43a2 protein n=1 Tax=Symbiodinium pilosum TaxID=2952 RepID=A0A812RKN1_SYMPI|nr:slc43a2 [Symbiodinium pilosum]